MQQRIMIVSTSPFVPSGYGNTSRGMLKMFAEMLGPDNVSHLSTYGHLRATLNLNGIVHFPMPEDDDMFSPMIYYMQKWKPTILLAHHNIWLWPGLRSYELFHDNLNELVLHSIVQPPIDSEPLVEGAIPVLKRFQHIVPISKYGKRVVEDEGIICHEPIPHGVDTVVWKPNPERRKIYRKKMQVDDDTFVFLINAVNHGNRKGLYETLMAFESLVVMDIKEKVVLFLNTDVTSPSGLNVVRIIRMLEKKTPRFRKHILFTSPQDYRFGMPEEDVIGLFDACDGVVNAAYGEGFGRVYIEAGAMEKPVIAAENSTSDEMVIEGKTGLVVGCSQEILGMPSATLLWPPNIEELRDAMIRLVERQDDGLKMGRNGREFVQERFTWNIIQKQWEYFFANKL